MKNIFYVFVLFVFSSCLTTLFAQTITYTANLSGQQEVLPVLTQASGQITARQTGNLLTIEGNFANLSSNFNGNAHIHIGFAGQNGDVFQALTVIPDADSRGGSISSLTNTFTLSSDETDALANRNFYINIHSDDYPGGEIRGQLLPEFDEVYMASLAGNQEVPSVVSSGSGGLMLELSGSQLTVSGAFSDLDGDFDTSVGAHLHLGLAGVNGPIAKALDVTVGVDAKSGIIDPDLNSFILTDEEVIALQSRAIYVNVHSTIHPGGEIRGQVTPAVTTLFRAHLSGNNEVPAITSMGSGTIIGELNGSVFNLSGAFDNLSSAASAAHIHLSFAGENGGVLHPLTITPSEDGTSGAILASNNSFDLNAGEIASLFRRGFYINIHTANFPDGELRGQLLPPAQTVFNAHLSGSMMQPVVETAGSGRLKAELLGDQLSITGSFTNLSGSLATSIQGGIIVHVGEAGTTGPISFSLMPSPNPEGTGGFFEAENNTFTLTTAQIANLKQRRNYIQIYSSGNIMGELRGQFLPDATTYLAASLSGGSTIPAINSTGSGMVLLEINEESGTLSGSFTDLSSNFVGTTHIHEGLAGTTIDIAVFLNATGSGATNGVYHASENTFAITPELLEKLLSRETYVDLHTTVGADGELRGQLLPFATNYYTAYLLGTNEVPSIETNAVGNLKLELNNDQLVVSGSYNGLSSDYDPSVGSHLHIARNGKNGDVAFSLTPALSFDDRSATYMAEDNTFTLSTEEIAALRAGLFYVNVHTLDFPMGEIRGQVLLEPNAFPPAVQISFPSEMETEVIEGLPTGTFSYEWLAPTQEDTLTYFWELADSPAFDNVLKSEFVDIDTSITFTLVQMDSLLANLGLAIDEEVDLFQRVTSSDGSLQTIGVPRVARLRRGVVTPPVAYTAQLSGSNEVLPVLTQASGNISAILTNLTLEVSGSFDNLTDTVLTALAGGAHIHIGYAGQNGDVAIPLNITLDPDSLGGTFEVANNTFTLTEDQRNAFINRQMYVNIHSAAFTGGELRGQIVPPVDQVYVSNLFGNNEVPAVMSSGHGALVLDLKDTTLTVSGSFADLDGDFDASIGGGAHLHFGFPGLNGDVTIALQVTADADLKGGIIDPANNTFGLNNEQLAGLSLRNIYANIHTTQHPSGELRGQITLPTVATFRAHLSGSNENPAVTTTAHGQIIAELLSDNSLVLSGSYNNLEGDLATEIAGGAHIHVGMAGENGMVLFPLVVNTTDNRSGILGSFANAFTLTDAAVIELMNRGLYINIHSAAHPNGELRGQLLPESQIVFNGNLAGIFEVPVTNTNALGHVKAELLGDQLTVSGTYHNLSDDLATEIAGGAHIHLGAAGQTGGVEFLLTSESDDMAARSGTFSASANTFTLTTEQIANLKARQNYVNIHSLAEAGGEIRAQLLPEATTYFVAPLGGNSEVPAVNTAALGMTIVEIHGENAVLTGSFNNLESNFNTEIAGGAHIHNAFAGSNGGVAFLINADTLMDSRSAVFTPANNQFAISAGQLDTMRQRMNYINIHSIDNAGGELRGQLLPLATTYFSTTLTGRNEVQPINTTASGSMKFELVDSMLMVSGSFNDLTGTFAAEIAGGSHLHLAPAGENGGVDFVLNASLSADSLAAVYPVDSNTFVLNDAEIEALRSGNYYVNIHSAAFNSGELRGQVLLDNNFFPSATTMITNPVDGDTLTLEGRPTDQMTINWTAAVDSSQLAYIWQLSPTSDFTTVLFENNVGNNLAITPTLGALDTLLATNNIAIGDTITLYHRAIASDGSLQTTGATAAVTIIRGEVVPPTGYRARLSGHNEALPVLSMASGMVTAELDGDSLKLAGRFDNLADTVLTELANGAHLHLGYAGQNGAVIQPLNIILDEDRRGGIFTVENNTYALADSLITALNNGQIYINIHSAAHPGGELRAQLLPDADLDYQTNLFGNNEMPTIMTQAHGALQLQVVDSQLVVSGSFADLEGDFAADIAGGAHLHIGMAGRNGDVDISLVATVADDLRSGVFTPENNTFTITQDQMDQLARRNVYANLHSTKFPAGELRGQVGAPNLATFRAHLSGVNEVPVVTTTAQGLVMAELVDDTTLVVHGSFENLESNYLEGAGSGAHIHFGTPGIAGAVEFELLPVLSEDGRSGTFLSGVNRFTITAAQKAALYDRTFYVNIHTVDNPGGEIRGHLLPEAQVVFNGHLAGIFEANPVNTAASGFVKAELLGDQLMVSGTFNNLTSAVATQIAGGAHIHLGAAGQSGGVEFPLAINLSPQATAGTFLAEANTFTLDSTQIANLRGRLNYVNIHTASNQGGELRGQLLPEATTYFLAALGGNSEVPAVNTSATGMAIVEVNGENAVLTGSFQGLESAFNTALAGGAHIHEALAGSNGGVKVLINIDTTATDTSGIFRAMDNQFTISSGLLDTMRQRMHYVNIHSVEQTGGEIRGQLLPFGNGYFTTNLLAINEVQPVQSAASGGLKIDLIGNEITVTGSFKDLASDFATEVGAHLHIGSAGGNGAVAFSLTPTLDSTMAGTFLAVDNQFELDEDQLDLFRIGNFYANIHSVDNPGGELRGQILPEINYFPSNPAITSPAANAMVEIDGMADENFIVNWSPAIDSNDLVYIWQLAPTDTFVMPLINANVAGSTGFTASYQEVDTLLATAGVAIGDSITLFHRAIASDGSLQGIGDAVAITLKRVEEDTTVIVDPPVVGDSTVYVAHLSGSNEVLPILTMASGTVTATLRDSILNISGRFDNLTDSVATQIVGGAHIHLGYAGENGDVIIPLNITLDEDFLGGTFEDTLNQFTLTTTQIEALENRQLYINLHTKAFTGGELRGQLIPADNEVYQTNLFGNYEVPTVMSNGQGALVLDIEGDTLTVSGTFRGLDGDFDASIAGGAHLHLGLAGQVGDVVIGLSARTNDDLRSGTFRATDNVFVLTSEQKTAIEQDNFYANLHTTQVASGEIRGQVHDLGLATFRAHLSGSNEVPVVTTTANGMIIATLLNDTTLQVSGSFMDLESDLATEIAGGAHLHLGAAGATGDVIFPLVVSNADDNRSGTFAKVNNTFTITAQQKAALYNREIYINIHSADHASGELRGQLLPESQVIFNGHLSGVFEVNPVTTNAHGAVKVELSGNQMTVSGSFTNLSSEVATEIAGGAHLHVGAAGRNGAVEFPLDMRLTSDFTNGKFLASTNTFQLSDEQVANLKGRLNYVNIHTETNQGGELRAQLVPEATTYFLAALGGNSEVPAVDTKATGMAIVEINGDNIVVNGSFMGLESTFNADLAGGVHIHNAFAGSNGSIVHFINTDTDVDSDTSGVFGALSNQHTISTGLVDTIRQRMTYVNVHSVDQPGGEIRGQLLPLGTALFTTNLLGINEVQPATTTAQGGLKLELTQNTLTVTGSFNDLSGTFDANIAGGAHLHIADPANNGDVTILLNTTVADDSLSGFYAAAENTFVLDSMQMAALFSGDIYANIHTTAIASGELRGQILPELNFFPQGDVAITAPADGTTIVTNLDLTAPFSVSWNPAMDRDDVVYIWQLAADSSFAAPLYQENVGFEPNFMTTFAVIDTLLIDNGVALGDTITLFHRAIASDGSVQTYGDLVSVHLVREMEEEVIDADYVVTLTGQNEVFPAATRAFGEVLVELDGNQMILEGYFRDLSSPVATSIAGGGHVHLGYAGQNGDVVFPINLTLDDDGMGGTIAPDANTFTLNSNQLNQLTGRQLYINIHTENFPGGELRGQFLPANNEVYLANMFGNNEVPTVLSEGHGAIILDLSGNRLTVSGAFDDLEGAVDTDIAGGAHLHLGVAGENGEVTIPLTVNLQGNGTRGRFLPSENAYDLDNEQLEALRNHGIYVNLHTTDFASGELRGQVAPLGCTNFRAHLSGSNEVPVVTSLAGGQINALFVNDTTLVVSGSFSNLESDINTELAGGAHIHIGYAGEAGAVVYPLNLQIADDQRNATISAEDNVFIVEQGTAELLYQRALYINIHSLEHAGGELRGQLLPESQAVFNGFLSGVFETPAVSTMGLGALKVELNGNQITVTGSLANLSSPIDESIAGGAHLHIAPAGRNGDVFVVLQPNITSDGLGANFLAVNNTFEISDDELFRLNTREVYANVHTLTEQSGELRAQLLPEATTYFVAPLSGASVVPATNTQAMGMMVAEVHGTELIMSGSFNGLSSTIAANVAGGTHLHRGLAGQIGERVAILSPATEASGTSGIFSIFGNTFIADAVLLENLRQRRQYVDIHTLDNRDGELRGQLLPLASAYFHTSLDGWNEVQPVTTDALGGLKMELTGNQLVVTGAFSDLMGDFDASIGGGAHLHLATVGANGDVILPLNVEAADNLRSGTLAADSNTFELNDEQLTAFQSGDFYANIHTTVFPSGELRGQVLAEINDFPSRSASINTPQNGSTLELVGDMTTAYNATWSTASDRDTLAYIYQLSLTPEFTEIMINENVAAVQLFSTDYATLDMILENAGVEMGEGITIYHRVIASDGSNYTAGTVSTLTINRGEIVGTANPILTQFSLEVFPTLTTANSTINVNITATERGAGQLTLFNQLGQLVDYQEIGVLNGINDFELQLAGVPAGMYFVQLEIDGVALPIEQVVVQ